MYLNALAGLLLGGFTGLLVGLSASPVVGSVLSVVVGGAAVFLSFKPSDAAASFDTRILVRLSTFSLAAIVAVLIGLTARTHRWFGGSVIAEEYEQLQSIGVSPDDARKIVVTRLTATKMDADSTKAALSALFADRIEDSQCETLNPDKFANANSGVTMFTNAGGAWSQFARGLVSMTSEDDKTIALKSAYSVFCSGK